VSGGLKGVVRGLNEWWGSRHVGWGPTGDTDDLKKKKEHKKLVEHAYEWSYACSG
jgi:hypothetical protein